MEVFQLGALSDTALRNGRHISRFEAKPYPQPLPATAVTRGFEAFAYPKLVRPCGWRRAATWTAPAAQWEAM
jgi:hypothetical protein